MRMRVVEDCVTTLCVFAVLVMAGCATIGPPQPWEKGELAKREMQFEPDPLDVKATF
jgi:hypothetical protein